MCSSIESKKKVKREKESGRKLLSSKAGKQGRDGVKREERRENSDRAFFNSQRTGRAAWDWRGGKGAVMLA